MNAQMFYEINNLLCSFFAAFDKREWSLMSTCLAPQVFIDYASSGRDHPELIDKHEFIRRRSDSPDKLSKQHSFSNLHIAGESEDPSITASCNYLILRFATNPATGDDFYHSCGQYRFQLKRHGHEWVIAAILQSQLRSWGNPTLHTPTSA